MNFEDSQIHIFEWDDDKNRINQRKHGISFEFASDVFNDPNRIEMFDEMHSTWEEDRTIVIGRAHDFVILFVVCTYRDGRTRLISARKAETEEEEAYYGNC